MARPDIVAEINLFNSPAQLIEFYEGSTRRAAEALGVTQRTIQRYITKGKQKRTPNKALLARAAAQRSEAGVGITFSGEIRIGSDTEAAGRERDLDRVYDQQQWEDLSALAAAGDEDGCWQFVADEYQVSYMTMASGTIDIGEE